MPIYEYTCPKCHKKKERFRSVDQRDAAWTCSACGMPMKRTKMPQGDVKLRETNNVFKKV